MKMKRVLAAVLAASMVVGAAGCMKKADENKKNEKKDAVAIPEDIWEPYEEEVLLNVVNRENPTYRFQDGDDYDNNPWYREYKERFNVKVKNKWVSADYSTKLNLSIAEGDLPDVFAVGAQRLKELQASDMIWDLSEVFDTQASPALKTLMEKNADIFETAKIDGKLYGVPQLSLGMQDYVGDLWVRKDWREEAGFGEGEVKTVADLEKMVKLIKEKHGKFGMTETNELGNMYTLAPAWGVYPKIWVEQKDGALGYGTVQPEMKEVLETYARWYKEGIIDPEFTITDSEKQSQKLLSEEAGVTVSDVGLAWGIGPSNVEMGADKYFEAYPVPSMTGEAVKSPVLFDNYGYIVVSKECKNPDAVLRLLNFYVYFMDEAGGKEDPELVNYMGELRNIPGSMRVFNPETELKRTERIIENLPQGSAVDTTDWGLDAGVYKSVVAVTENQDPTHGGEYFTYGGENTAYGVGTRAVREGNVMKDKAWGPATETMQKVGSTLDSLLLEGFTKIIVGEKPVEYFDTLVEEWAKAGGETLTKEVNDIYGK